MTKLCHERFVRFLFEHPLYGISHVYLRHILGISQTFLRYISGMHQAYLRYILGIYQVYFRQISDIVPLYLPLWYLSLRKHTINWQIGSTVAKKRSKMKMTIFQHWLRESLFARPRRESLNLYSTIYKTEEEVVKCELVCSIRK